MWVRARTRGGKEKRNDSVVIAPARGEGFPTRSKNAGARGECCIWLPKWLEEEGSWFPRMLGCIRALSIYSNKTCAMLKDRVL